MMRFVAVSTVAMWISAAPLMAQTEKIEKGRQVVAQVCAACHTTIVRMVQVHKQTAEQWKDTVYFMISRGAQLMHDEVEPVVAFLAATAGSSPAGGRGRPAADVDGAAILQRTCQQCHELATASKKLDSEEWDAVVARMITYGAKLTPADRQKLVEYLKGK